MRGRGGGRTLSVAYGDSSPEGRALGRTSKFRPHRSTAGRSLPLSSKLFASAKASPFRERWHGEAVTERVAFGTNPLSRLRRQLSRRESPWQRGQVSSSPVNGRKKPAVKQQTFRLCQSLSLSGEVARRSRDGEGCFQDEPLPSFRFAKCHLPRRWRPGQRGQVSSSPVNGRKTSADKRKTFRPCQSLSLSGEVARRSRDGEGRFQDEPSQSPTATASSPFCRLAATSSPGRGKSFEGRALGKKGNSRPYRSTPRRSELVSP